jgi:hypothetical protein
VAILRGPKILIQKAQFLLWKQRNPSGSFKDYFLEIVKGDLARGVAHPTLGPNLQGESFELSGQNTFSNLARRYDIQPDDVCVDYGCGTLRVGVHAVRYLNPGCYWGMDIGEFLLAEGRELIGSDLLNEKMPHLHVISDEAVAKSRRR